MTNDKTNQNYSDSTFYHDIHSNNNNNDNYYYYR